MIILSSADLATRELTAHARGMIRGMELMAERAEKAQRPLTAEEIRKVIARCREHVPS